MQTFMKIHARQWGKKIVLAKSKVTLAQLLENVTPENIHAETQTGPVKGKEIW